METTALAERQQITRLDDETVLQLVAGGDTSRLSAQQKLTYYNARCEAAGLDPRTHPFEFTKLSGKEVLYAKKAASDSLASKHGIVTRITGKENIEGILVVTVRATARDGRETEDVGAVSIAHKKGDDLANAMMKAVTKAKRRAVLSLCGLGMNDETELETVPSDAQRTASARPALATATAGTTTVEQPAEPEHDPLVKALLDRIAAAQTQADLDGIVLDIKRDVTSETARAVVRAAFVQRQKSVQSAAKAA